MAPRRGGGGGGGGGDGGGSSGIGDTPWGVKISLYGTHFTNPYRTASVVFQAIGVVGIVAIMIWAATVKKHQEPNKKLFRWFAFWLTAIALFVYVHKACSAERGEAQAHSHSDEIQVGNG